MLNRLLHLIACRVTFIGLMAACFVARAQDLFPATAVPDASQYTAAIFVSYQPGRTDEAVLKTYQTIRRRSPGTRLFILLTDQDRTAHLRALSSCESSGARVSGACAVNQVLNDGPRVTVIPLEQTRVQLYPQDHLQFFLRDGRPTLMPVAHIEDSYSDIDPRFAPRGIENTSQIVSRTLGIPLESLGIPTRGSEVTMGGNIESLPGNVLVVGDDRAERLPRSDQAVGREILQSLPPARLKELEGRLPQIVANQRTAERTREALLEYLKSLGLPLLRLDTKLLPIHHADEAFSVLRTNAPCGFSVLIPSPSLALEMLKKVPEGDPRACIRRKGPDASFGGDGRRLDAHIRAGCVGFRGETASSILRNQKLVSLNLDLAAAMRSNEQKIAIALKPVCDQVDFIPLPFLIDGFGQTHEATFPNPVNALVITPPRGASSWLNNPTFVSRFDDLTIRELQKRGIDMIYVRTPTYFEGQGGFHCGTATLQLDSAPRSRR